MYAGTVAAQLSQALDSIDAQTRPPEQVLLVADGPISEAVDTVLSGYAAAHTGVTVLRFPDNRGSGPASNAALPHVTGDYLARLDSDDIAAPQRLEKQLAFLSAHPEIAVCGTAVAEFTEDPSDASTRRALPADHADIVAYARWNSPVNNPSATMRTAAVRAVGGYRDVHFMEDYDLWARLIAADYHFANLPEALTYFRVSPAQFDRRTAGMFRAEWHMQTNLVHYGLIGWPRALINLGVRSAYRLLPRRLLTRVYAVLFHR